MQMGHPDSPDLTTGMTRGYDPLTRTSKAKLAPKAGLRPPALKAPKPPAPLGGSRKH